MNEVSRYGTLSSGSPPSAPTASPARGDGLLDILDRVLDKGVVIAGDIRISLLDIELLTIKIRLLIASADKAREMGIDWWARDPQLSSAAKPEQERQEGTERDNKALRERVDDLESRLAELLDRQPVPVRRDAGRSSSVGGGRRE